jgi:hypothetical protein
MGCLSSFNYLKKNDEPIKKLKKLEVTQNSSFYVKMECLAFNSPIYMSQRVETFGKRYGIK